MHPVYDRRWSSFIWMSILWRGIRSLFVYTCVFNFTKDALKRGILVQIVLKIKPPNQIGHSRALLKIFNKGKSYCLRTKVLVGCFNGGKKIFLQKIYINFSLEWVSYGFVETVVYSLSIFLCTLLRGNNCFPSRFFYSKIIQSIRVAVFACGEVHAGRQYDIKAMGVANASMEGGVHSVNILDHFISYIMW